MKRALRTGFNRAMKRKRQAAELHDQQVPHHPPAPAATPYESDVADPRAKSTGHGKKTADKWNQ